MSNRPAVLSCLILATVTGCSYIQRVTSKRHTATRDVTSSQLQNVSRLFEEQGHVGKAKQIATAARELTEPTLLSRTNPRKTTPPSPIALASDAVACVFRQATFRRAPESRVIKSATTETVLEEPDSEAGIVFVEVDEEQSLDPAPSHLEIMEETTPLEPEAFEDLW